MAGVLSWAMSRVCMRGESIYIVVVVAFFFLFFQFYVFRLFSLGRIDLKWQNAHSHSHFHCDGIKFSLLIYFGVVLCILYKFAIIFSTHFGVFSVHCKSDGDEWRTNERTICCTLTFALTDRRRKKCECRGIPSISFVLFRFFFFLL